MTTKKAVKAAQRQVSAAVVTGTMMGLAGSLKDPDQFFKAARRKS